MQNHSFRKFTTLFLLVLITQAGCQKGNSNQLDIAQHGHSEKIEDDLELEFGQLDAQGACTKASSVQIAQVDLGNSKLQSFIDLCRLQTNSSPWCDQVARPNPNSHNAFDCTYSAAQPHFLIHPEESTWAHAITGVQIVKELEQMNIKVCTIYNWWRPEPYNRNVGGASGRHPFGTSIDVRFCSKNDQLKAHRELCKMRKQGRLRALGYYSTTALHLGVGDKVANTWGKSCP